MSLSNRLDDLAAMCKQMAATATDRWWQAYREGQTAAFREAAAEVRLQENARAAESCPPGRAQEGGKE